jgi:hypothetical protein
MSVLGQSLTNVIVVIALVIAPGASRVVRGTVLALKQGRPAKSGDRLGGTVLAPAEARRCALSYSAWLNVSATHSTPCASRAWRASKD